MILTQPAEDHPGKHELRLASADQGATWWFYDDEEPPPHMVQLPDDLLPQVEIVGSTERNLTGRIVFDPTLGGPR